MGVWRACAVVARWQPEHTRFGSRERVARSRPAHARADANLCGESCARTPFARPRRRSAARRWRGWACTDSPGTTTKRRRARRSTRSSTDTCASSFSWPPHTAARWSSAPRSRCCPGYGAAAHWRSIGWSRCPACSPPRRWGCGWRRACAARRDEAGRAIAIGMCTANPLTLSALEHGHPEELLGAALCMRRGAAGGTVLVRPRPLAVGRRAAGPGDREQGVGGAGHRPGAAGAAARPPAAMPGCRCGNRGGVPRAVDARGLGRGVHSGASVDAFASAAIFQPWQVWWFLGQHGSLVHGLFGIPRLATEPGPRGQAQSAIR